MANMSTIPENEEEKEKEKEKDKGKEKEEDKESPYQGYPIFEVKHTFVQLPNGVRASRVVVNRGYYCVSEARWRKIQHTRTSRSRSTRTSRSRSTRSNSTP